MSDVETAVVVRPRNDVATQETLSVSEIVRQVGLIQEVMQAVMKDGEHYGVIPGTVKKTLLKPGAEKLGLTFRLRPEYEISEAGLGPAPGNSRHIQYRITCTLWHIVTGAKWGAGVGVCSTMESKFRYRYLDEATDAEVPRSYWDQRKSGADPATLQNILAIASGGGHPAGTRYGTKKNDAGVWVVAVKSKSENPDVADTYNTVLKMAKKRAHVDAMLTCTAASDIFTQDLEDFTAFVEVAAPVNPPSPPPPPRPPGGRPVPPNCPDDHDQGEQPEPEAKRVANLQRRIWAVARDLSAHGSGHDNKQVFHSVIVVTADDIWKAVQHAGAAFHEPNPSQPNRYVVMGEQPVAVLEKLAQRLTAVRVERLKVDPPPPPPLPPVDVHVQEVFGGGK